MNLNFYPNSFNQPNINPYSTLLGLDNGNSINRFQSETEGRLQQLQNQINQNQNQFQNQFTPQVQNQGPTQDIQQNQQPYYLFCGNKNDWDEFLILNYGITEKAIFDDYKLFLQAKQEIIEEQGQSKINIMKDKIRNKNNKGITNVDATIKSNVKPNIKNKSNINRVNDSVNLEHSSKPSDGLLEQNKLQPKESINKK